MFSNNCDFVQAKVLQLIREMAIEDWNILAKDFLGLKITLGELTNDDFWNDIRRSFLEDKATLNLVHGVNMAVIKDYDDEGIFIESVDVNGCEFEHAFDFYDNYEKIIKRDCMRFIIEHSDHPLTDFEIDVLLNLEDF